MKKNNKSIINRDKCKGCQLCLNECPVGIIVVSDDVNALGYHPAMITDMSKCTGCIKCAISCPEGIITVIRED